MKFHKSSILKEIYVTLEADIKKSIHILFRQTFDTKIFTNYLKT